MLVLTRRRHEEIAIGDNITIQVIEVRGSRMRLGFEAPDEVPIRRAELWDGELDAEFDFEHRERVLCQTQDR